jgi:hypothetical protein
MIAALAFASRWLLAGGWKIVAVALLAIFVGLSVTRIRHWQSEAAKVPLLSSVIADSDKRLRILLQKLDEAEQRRGAAEAALSAWQSTKAVTLEPITESGRHASASTNALCLPSAADRGMRNAAIRQLLDPVAAGSESAMPAAARAP